MGISTSNRELNLRSAEVEPKNLVDILETVNTALPKGEKFCYLMADYWNEAGCFVDFSAGKQQLSQTFYDCISGSAFGMAAELRWRKVGDKLRLALIAEANFRQLPANVQWKDRNDQVEQYQEPPDEGYILLWGTKYLKDQKAWIEARIPRTLNYPSDPNPDGKFEHVRLYFVEYRDKRGRPIIQRRTQITAHIEKKKGEENNGEETSQS